MPGGLSRTARIACVVGAVLAVFVAWVAAASPNSGIGFFYCVPVGLAAWWFGPRAGVLLAAICLALYVVGDAIHPVSEFALAIGIRAVF
ncbi:MAG TPA: hypothetical protein VFP21_06010, partial [Solirubrobacterales bacterium]|nr:hypothetical protein [Solirubrobacterales bacterium]